MRQAVLAAALLVADAPAALAGPPSYDIPKFCRWLGSGSDTLAAFTYQACLDGERLAYKSLAARWSSVPEATRNECVGIERDMGGQASYAGLKSCIDGFAIYTDWKKAHPEADMSVAGRGGPGATGTDVSATRTGGTTGSTAARTAAGRSVDSRPTRSPLLNNGLGNTAGTGDITGSVPGTSNPSGTTSGLGVSSPSFGGSASPSLGVGTTSTTGSIGSAGGLSSGSSGGSSGSGSGSSQ